MGFLNILDSDQLNHVHSTTQSSMEHIKKENPYKIHLDTSVKRVSHPPLRVPVVIHDALKEKLDKMVADGVITPVTEATDCVSSIAVVRKPPGALRICINPKDLNRAIKDEHYPLSTIEELTTRRIGNAKVFPAMGFWQVPLDEKSSKLTCFNTPIGRYRWLRIPFGLNSASEVCQRRMQEIIEGLPGTEVIFDDFLIIARLQRHNQASCTRPKQECNPVLGTIPSEEPEAKSQHVTVSITRDSIHWSRAHTRGSNSNPAQRRSRRSSKCLSLVTAPSRHGYLFVQVCTQAL